MPLNNFTDGVTQLDAATFDAIITAVNAAVPNWQPQTSYAAGQYLLDPYGNTVKAKVPFVSGTTYSAANLTPVGDYGLLYVGFSSPSDVSPPSQPYEKMQLLSSADGHTFTGAEINPLYTDPNTGASFRDPSILKIGSTCFCAYTVNNGLSKNFGLIKSTDLVNWTSLSGVANTPTLVDVSAATSLNQAWAPELLTDGANVYAFFADVTSGGGQSLWYVKFTDSTGLTTWNAPVAVSWTSAPAYAIDPAVVWDANHSTYRMFFANAGVINRASCSTLTGTWTVDKTGDWAGWLAGLGANSHCEAPELVQSPSGTWRIYFDPYFGTASPYTHTGYYYSETSDVSSTSWSAPVKCAKGPGFPPDGMLRHGGFVQLANAADRTAVNNAMSERAPFRHAEYTCGNTTAASGLLNIGTPAIDNANSYRASDFIASTPAQQIVIGVEGVYSIDFFTSLSAACGGGWMAIKGPSQSPNYASNDLVSTASAWSIPVSNVHLAANTTLQFYLDATASVTSSVRIRITKEA